MARRKLPDSRPINRRQAYIQPKLLLVVCCEGKNTEPRYLKEFAAAYGNKLVEIQAVAPAGAPYTLVERAIEEKSALARKAAKDKNSFSAAFQVWGVFDIDEHPRVNDAKNLARQHGIKLCISNPCFDLWGLLHFCNQDGEIHRHDAQRLLAIKMPKYDPDGAKTFDYELLHPRFSEAKTKAVRLIQRRMEEDIAGGNPSTNIFELLDVIIENGRKLTDQIA